MATARNIADVLGGQRVLHRDILTTRQLADLIQSESMPRESLDILTDRIGAGDGFRFRIVPKATYHRRPFLNREHAQNTERIARIFALLREIWGNDEDARGFLLEPHPELSGDRPLDRAMTELGAREVEEVIGRAQHGFPL